MLHGLDNLHRLDAPRVAGWGLSQSRVGSDLGRALALVVGLGLALSACSRREHSGATLAEGPAASVVPAAAAEPVPPPGDTRRGDDGAPASSGQQKADRPVAGVPQVAVGLRGAVASAEANATDIGIGVLKRGGNAIDAAVAVGFALSVTHPSAANIGGGGFMVVRFPDGRSTAIDYREVAPGAALRDMYLDASGEVTTDSRVGARAAGIPGNVAGFFLAHRRYGSMPWRDLVAPAVRLARDGYTLDSFHAEDLERGTARMEKAGFAAAAKTFLRPDGSRYVSGDLWKQPDLAATLEAIASGGRKAFYGGALAREMVAGVRKLGGIWTTKDLAGYRAIERETLVFEYRGHEVIAMPPPSAGGVVLRQILAASEALTLHKYPWQAPDQVHLYVETLRRTYADRNLLIADPDFVQIPTEKLLDVSYIQQRVASIDPLKATPSDQIRAGTEVKESRQTTHFSVVDSSGLAVSNTFTLNGGFGAKLVIPGTGVILNNEMDDFTAKPGSPNMFGLVQGPQNAIAPGKRMLSSMTPTILVRGGRLRAVVGSPGGPTITTTVAQIIMQLVDHGRTLEEAVASPRIHHQWLPDAILHEPGISDELAENLKRRGHQLKEWRRIGHVNAIEVDPKTRELRAVADVVRDGGKAAAY
ncbi:MAG: gamma-glutamyltransferase [Nannocystaceae bacterium]